MNPRWAVAAIFVIVVSGRPARARQDPEQDNGSPAAHQHQHKHATDDPAGGPFRSANAVGSGTALQPSSTPMWGWHFELAGWDAMVHGVVKAGFSDPGGLRGVAKAQSQNWGMLAAGRRLGPGRLTLRAMTSAEPLTAPHGGFPQLYQTGETYRSAAIIDAQHPHDLFMELAASYSVPLSERVSLQVYGGPVAEPALGPVAFMHRASAVEIPASPLGHHWQDSTHVSHGVVTGAVTISRFKVEFSRFRGAEPDEDRVGIDLGGLDSYSFRGWFTPTPDWAMQLSYGHLTQPEVLHSGDVNRWTASISHHRRLGSGSWSSTAVWGRNLDVHGVSNSYLFESTVDLRARNHLYTRLELGDKQGLLDDNIFGRSGLVCTRTIVVLAAPGGRRVEASERPSIVECVPAGVVAPGTVITPVLHGGTAPTPGRVYPPAFFNAWARVGALTFGGVRDIVTDTSFRIGVGVDVTVRAQPSRLDPIYGAHPVSFQVFLRLRPGEMR